MKRTKAIVCTGLILAMIAAMALTGCKAKNQSGLTVDEPEITVEYLEGEYVEQLLRDGAEHVFGNITLSKNEDGSVGVNIEARELVEDSSQPGGFYLEDRNYTVDTFLAQEARCTFISKGVSLPQIMSAEQFVNAYDEDMAKNGDNAEYQKYKLYDMYIMGGQIELILARYLP